jgi:hypothetical protein
LFTFYLHVEVDYDVPCPFTGVRFLRFWNEFKKWHLRRCPVLVTCTGYSLVRHRHSSKTRLDLLNAVICKDNNRRKMYTEAEKRFSSQKVLEQEFLTLIWILWLQVTQVTIKCFLGIFSGWEPWLFTYRRVPSFPKRISVFQFTYKLCIHVCVFQRFSLINACWLVYFLFK